MDEPALTRDQSRALDRRAIEDYGIASLVLMENAGRGCVDVLERLGIRGPVVILCGKGNNAGDGFVIARHLLIRGYECRVLPVEGESYEENPPTILDFIKRDHRWCNGNMQYFPLVGLRGLVPLSRFQIVSAIAMYFGGPAWMLMTVAAASLIAFPPAAVEAQSLVADHEHRAVERSAERIAKPEREDIGIAAARDIGVAGGRAVAVAAGADRKAQDLAEPRVRILRIVGEAAAAISAAVLPTPEKTMRWPGTPRAMARRNSPSETTSMPAPRSAKVLTTAWLELALME